MPELSNINVSSLKLDLNNYRTVHQRSELKSINAMIAVSPDWFWSLMESIIDDGYYPTDNIIILKTNNEFIVKEGNRRIASLKIIYGYINGIEIPENIKRKISELDEKWKNRNINIPCAIYEETEIEAVKKLISLIHARGEKAGREKWTAVARTRYDRDEKNKKETGLDLLEKYLVNGKNLSSNQKECWGGDYPITVLNELLPKLCPYINYDSSEKLIKYYPEKKRNVIEKILYDIGIQKLGFKEIRNKTFWGFDYGLTGNKTAPKPSTVEQLNVNGKNSTQSGSNAESETVNTPKVKGKKLAYSITDKKSVVKKLKEFKPVGNNREKVVALLEEMRRLNIETHPFSFCFLLRSMFEISAKAYCQDHKKENLSSKKKDGFDKTLSDLLRDIVKFMTSNGKNKEKEKTLHGALTELNKKDGILSVTSLNHLIHNPGFSIISTDLCKIFHNIFPLLEEMNN